MNKPSFLNLPRPILVCITGETTIEANIANIRNAEYEGAHAFAIHLEKVGQANHSDEALRRMAGCTRKPVMMLHYRDAGAFPARTRMRNVWIFCGAQFDAVPPV